MKKQMIMRYPTTWHGEMWREGAPCGNGILGALVYGAVDREIIAINHTRLWSGGRICNIPDVSDRVEKVREYLDENRPDLANSVLSSALREKGYDPAFMSLKPLCDIKINRINPKPIFGYERVVDFEKAEVRLSWDENGCKYVRNTFVSRDNGLCYVKMTCSQKGRISTDISLDVHDRETIHSDSVGGIRNEIQNDVIIYSGENESVYFPANGDYGAVMRVVSHGGAKRTINNRIIVEGADEVTLILGVFVGDNREKAIDRLVSEIKNASEYDTALTAHETRHRALFDGADFELTANTNELHSNEELLLDAFTNGMSNELCETLYHYGRYLLVCSTGTPKENALPTHLIGLWNGTYSCFWAFHMFNVNFEMIYWQALSSNRPELLRTALDYVESFMDDYRENAEKIFGCHGIYIDSVNTPESGKAACLADHIINWTAGAAWLSQHFYDYYRYTGDRDYLVNHALPFMYESALFYEDFLKDKNGYLEFAPSTSPENVALNVSGELNSSAQVSKNASMDIAAVRELLTNLIEATNETGLYSEKKETWNRMLDKLPEYKYNPDGSLKEWADDFYIDNNHHRHHSHMYGIFPGHSFEKGSREYEGAVKAEDNRIDIGMSDQSSWSLVFMSCVNARLGRAKEALFA
ncbi:MAG: glycoside hydrolase N-terminal domain-containing protein, partial [Clostridia bacterium]|nr:glycoside hydrolase N-terminal domain-containing protein [Clostridia bacterium]